MNVGTTVAFGVSTLFLVFSEVSALPLVHAKLDQQLALDFDDICVSGAPAECHFSLRQLRAKLRTAGLKRHVAGATKAGGFQAALETGSVSVGAGTWAEKAFAGSNRTRDNQSDRREVAAFMGQLATTPEIDASMPAPPSVGELWGGPSRAWAEQSFVAKVFPTNDPRRVMDFARLGSAIPESLWGIFWMDQFGKSSIAQDPEYPFEMLGTNEILVSFGDATYEEHTGCVTPVPCYGGPHWTFLNDQFGNNLLEAHLRQRNTLSFCFATDDYIQIYQKVLTSEASLGSVPVGGSYMAWMLGFEDAGQGYSWAPRKIIDMSMKKTPWGWDRITSVLQQPEKYAWPVRGLLREVAKAMPISHFPLIQIINGRGEPTRYYSEYLRFMAEQKQPDELLVGMPER